MLVTLPDAISYLTSSWAVWVLNFLSFYVFIDRSRRRERLIEGGWGNGF